MTHFSNIEFFNRYFGACGRFAVFEDAGQPLESFKKSSWTVRARLSLQILKLAQKMSEHLVLSLYLTDWSIDNFAVSKHLEVKLIDLEDIVIVNKTLIEAVKAPGWDIEHHSVAFGCEHKCFSYSVSDLCSHRTSDHNYFGACFVIAKLLSNDAPDPMTKRLVQECTWPSNPGGRIEAALQLINQLEQV